MKILGTIGIVLTILGLSVWQIWEKFIRPRTLSERLKRFYFLVEEWFDEIDRSNIDDLNPAALNNREKKIRSFIADHNLEHIEMTFPLSFRRKFLESCGIKRELRSDEELFVKYSRCPTSGLTVGAFWDILVGEFWTFKSRYSVSDQKTNFADVEMRVKLLRMYTGAKAT